MKAPVILVMAASFLVAAPVAPASASRVPLSLEVLSSRPDQVSGGVMR
ncbi:hypothetical protein [Nonomuraea salmonea]